MNDYYISLESQEQAVNSNLSIRYKPASDINNYSYIIYKDGEKFKEEQINQNDYVGITLEETGSYKIEFHNFDLNNQESIIETGTYQIDKEVPSLKVEKKKITLRIGDEINVLDYVKATDNYDGDITSEITTNIDELDFNQLGNKKLVYQVSDSAGNSSMETLYINVVQKKSNNLFIIQFTMISFVVITLFFMFWYRIGLKKERRLARYSVEPLQDDSLSLFGKLLSQYNILLASISKLLSKSVFIEKYSRRYQKYIDTLGDSSSTTMKFVANKIVIGILFVLLALFYKSFYLETLKLYETFIPFLVGFLVPDFIYAYKYHNYRSKMENDLLQAIIIMNNAFKSGKSIYQAIDIVSGQLDGVMAEEFKKMSLELSFGLSIEVVFSRLSKRIQLEEVTYLTASLSILNRTGGNIIKVFSSIEKTLFNKKKLQLEMKSLTGSAKIITYLLIGLPLIFIIFISLLNTNYFTPLFTSPMGIVILIIILTLYITYILVVRKVMKIRM